MDANAAHRKIELQSAADFTYLTSNVRRAAAESIQAAFPPVDDEQDDLHRRVEELVNEVRLPRTPRPRYLPVARGGLG